MMLYKCRDLLVSNSDHGCFPASMCKCASGTDHQKTGQVMSQDCGNAAIYSLEVNLEKVL